MPIVRTEVAQRRRQWKTIAGLSLVAIAAELGVAEPSWAQVALTLSGPPVQVTPYASEPGVPIITITPGSVNPFPSGSGTGTGSSGGDSSGTTSAGDNDALNTLLSQSWGSTAVSNAEAVGLNPSALAATCVVESGCQNVNGASGAQGAFQMYPAAYQEGLQTALAANPSLASQIVQGSAGMNDPTTEAIAASGYLLMASQTLESAGVSSPTVLDARGYYNFGPSYGSQLALADADEPIANELSGMSQSTLTQNGITAGETVGQWRASVSSTIGNAAGQSITT
jgi:hypothetical protein